MAKSTSPVVLGGEPTWAPQGEVRWDRWGGTAPSWDVDLNALDHNAVTWPMATAEDALALAEVAAGAWAYNGPKERELRAQLAERAGATHCITCANGTVALTIAYSAIVRRMLDQGVDLPENPEVIVPAATFYATASTAAACGLDPVGVDVEPDTLVPSVEAVEAAITPDTVAIVAVPLYASCPALDGLRALADRHGLALVIDGAHAPFGRWNEQPFAAWADIVTTSFQLGKVYTAGEGGCVYTNDAHLAALASMIVNVGVRPAPEPAWWPTGVGDVQGENHRMAEPSAALLLTQLRLYTAQERRREDQYARFLAGLADSGLPFGVLRHSGQGVLYKVGIVNGTGIAIEPLRRALRLQLTGEVGAPYPALSQPASRFRPDTLPSQFGSRGRRLRQGSFPVAEAASDRLLLAAHDFWLRGDAAQHMLKALEVIGTHEVQLAAWAVAQTD